MPPLESMINLYDFEQLAEKVLSRTGWAYYRSAANGEDSECFSSSECKIGDMEKGVREIRKSKAHCFLGLNSLSGE